jgi:hypothetical protein
LDLPNCFSKTGRIFAFAAWFKSVFIACQGSSLSIHSSPPFSCRAKTVMWQDTES